MTNFKTALDSKEVNSCSRAYFNNRCRNCHFPFSMNPLLEEDWNKITANFVSDMSAGRFISVEEREGEYIQQTIDYLAGKNIFCSIITDISLLTPEFIERNSGKLQMIGINVNALDDGDTLKVGALEHYGQELLKDLILGLAKTIHSAGIMLKINTVLNAFNCRMDFTPLIKALAPEQWMLLRILHHGHADMMIKDEELDDFVNRHQALQPVVEDSDHMFTSYIRFPSHISLQYLYDEFLKPNICLLDC